MSMHACCRGKDVFCLRRVPPSGVHQFLTWFKREPHWLLGGTGFWVVECANALPRVLFQGYVTHHGVTGVDIIALSSQACCLSSQILLTKLLAVGFKKFKIFNRPGIINLLSENERMDRSQFPRGRDGMVDNIFLTENGA